VHVVGGEVIVDGDHDVLDMVAKDPRDWHERELVETVGLEPAPAPEFVAGKVNGEEVFVDFVKGQITRRRRRTPTSARNIVGAAIYVLRRRGKPLFWVRGRGGAQIVCYTNKECFPHDAPELAWQTIASAAGLRMAVPDAERKRGRRWYLLIDGEWYASRYPPASAQGEDEEDDDLED